MSSVVDTATGDETAVPTRGRPREFDADLVLDALVQLFWEQGYEATSMADIVEATGLNKSSLYNAFGSKDRIFERALNRYVDNRAMQMVDVLANGTRGLDDVAMVLDAIWQDVTSNDDHRGCMAVNSSTELGQRDDVVIAISERFRTAMRDSLHAAFQRAADHGEIDSSDVDNYSNMIVSFILGTTVIIRGGASDDEIRTHLDSGRAILNSWRVR